MNWIPFALVTTLFFHARQASDNVSIIKPDECVDKFEYKGEYHTGCISLNGAVPWCSTEEKYNGSWLYCTQIKEVVNYESYFKDLLKEVEQHEQKLDELNAQYGGNKNACVSCMNRVEAAYKIGDDEKRMYLDQNKRLYTVSVTELKLDDNRQRLNSLYEKCFCKDKENAVDYIGKIDYTKTGKRCLDWSSVKSDWFKYVDADFPDGSKAKAKNYCRNPGHTKGNAWCFVANYKTEECLVPTCGIDCHIQPKANASDPKPHVMCHEYEQKVCPSGYTHHYRGKCYYIRKEAKYTWEDANKKCKGYGGNLVSIHDYFENQIVASMINHNDGMRYWIGLKRVKKGGEFAWSDGTTYKYSKWSPGEPNNVDGGEDCAEMNYYAATPDQWNDNKCSDKLGFICQEAGESVKA